MIVLSIVGSVRWMPGRKASSTSMSSENNRPPTLERVGHPPSDTSMSREKPSP
jgi:hypothetical protein